MVPAQPFVVIPVGYRADKFADCVQNAIHRVCANLQFFPPEKFVDSLFPWFEPNTAPKNEEDLDALLKNRLVQERIDKLDVRYVITIGGQTSQSECEHVISEDDHFLLKFLYGTLYLAIGSVVIEADRRTNIYASVFDLEKAKLPLKAESHKDKTSRYAGVAFIIPLYIQPAITETSACYEIGKTIAQQISGCEPAVDKEVEYNK